MTFDIVEGHAMTLELVPKVGAEAVAIPAAVGHHAKQPSWNVGVNEMALLVVVDQHAQIVDLRSRGVIWRTMNDRVVVAAVAGEFDERLLPGEARASPREFLLSDGVVDVLVLYMPSELDEGAAD